MKQSYRKSREIYILSDVLEEFDWFINWNIFQKITLTPSLEKTCKTLGDLQGFMRNPTHIRGMSHGICYGYSITVWIYHGYVPVTSMKFWEVKRRNVVVLGVKHKCKFIEKQLINVVFWILVLQALHLHGRRILGLDIQYGKG